MFVSFNEIKLGKFSLLYRQCHIRLTIVVTSPEYCSFIHYCYVATIQLYVYLPIKRLVFTGSRKRFEQSHALTHADNHDSCHDSGENKKYFVTEYPIAICS